MERTLERDAPADGAPGAWRRCWPGSSVLALPFGGVAQAQSDDGLLVPSVPLMMVDAEAVTEGKLGRESDGLPGGDVAATARPRCGSTTSPWTSP